VGKISQTDILLKSGYRGKINSNRW